MNKNDNEVLKKTLLHYIDLDYYSNIMNEDFQYLLSELQDKCKETIGSLKTLNTKTAYNAIMKIVKEEVDRFKSELEHRLAEEAENVLFEELQFLDKTYNKPESGDGMGLKLTGVAVSSLLFASVAGNDTATQFAERTGKNIYNSYDTSLRAGYLFGQNTDDIITQTNMKLKRVSQGMQNGIRTAIPGFAKTADRIVFLNNNVEVVWVATLDGRTCITCASLSGLHFKSIAEAPTTPHFLCRCQLIAADKITEPIPDFEEFVEMLDEEEQRHVLGENRFTMWKQYHMQLRSFINHGEVISLDELKEKYARLIENKNLVIPEKKLAGYALNPNHSTGKDKAKVFKSTLGYTVDNWRDLEENIRNHLNQKDMEFTKTTEFGNKYRNDVEITGPNGETKVVRTAWLKKDDSDEYQLITVYVR